MVQNILRNTSALKGEAKELHEKAMLLSVKFNRL